jgi:hypothetical protein
LIQKQFLDLNLSFKDIELTRFSSYSAKFIGYEIKKGKLVLDLNYKLDNNILLARNRLFLDQFTLGKKVDSKDATTLPVPLAISLLKNAQGQIDLDVPITGNLDDPEFKLSNAFFEVFGNLIMKVVTAPFKILGAMFGGGEELGFVNFAHGSDSISDKAIEKLDTLIEILDQKKSLKLEIQGTYDRNSDGEALRKKEYEVLIASGKMKSPAAKGATVSASETISLPPEERASAILSAYEQAAFPKPREEDGTEKQISNEEKEKLLLTHIEINEGDLKELAIARAENIKHYILAAAKVDSARIFLLNPVEAEVGSDPEQSGRVNFSIK